MSLADQIVERNTNSSPNTEVDEFGIPIPKPETPEYLVARALMWDNRDWHQDNPWVTGLHLRGDVIYKYHTPIKETKKQILALTHLKRNLKDWEEVEFWRVLKEHLPKLYRNILQISDDLYWDIDKAELINRQQAEERSKSAV